MKERPILFSSSMVRAILDGTKTQTRRVVKTDPGFWNYAKEQWVEDGFWLPTTPSGKIGTVPPVKCPYGATSDRLWVREAWAEYHDIENDRGQHVVIGKDIIYRADGEEQTKHTLWKPSIFMPRAASRITLEIVSVRVERLQDISEEDAKAEGIATTCPCAGGCDQHRKDFCLLWESIHGLGSWGSNPWVWCIEFKRVEVSR